MDVNNTIVTAIYYHTPYSRIGGRGYSWLHYVAPFTNLLNLDANIVVYTHDKVEQDIKNFFKDKQFTNYRIINYNLLKYKYSDIIFSLKEKLKIIDENGLTPGKSIISNDRNHHLCLSKIDFLLDSINNQYFNTKNYYWVDGGLFHHGLIPERFGGIERMTTPNSENYWPINKNSICNPNFFPKLDKKKTGDLLFLGLDNYHGRPQILDKPNISKNLKISHIIGGLFGGTPDKLKELSIKFNDVLLSILKEGYLTLEEEVLSIVYSDYFQTNTHLNFTHWGHDIPEERNYLEVPPGSNSFYKLFL